MTHQFPNNIQLMITREDDLLGFLDVGRAVRHDLFFFGLFVTDEFLKNIHQLILLQHILPEVRCNIAAGRIRRIACTAVSACTVAALIEGQEVCHGSLKLCGHINIVEVAGKVSQDALVETEHRLLGITIICPLLFCFIHGLSRQLILKFYGDNRDAIEGKQHINAVLVLLGIMPLPDALTYILLIVRYSQVVQFGLRFEIAHTEIDAAMLEAVAENGNQSVLCHGVLKGLVELAYRVDGTHPFKTLPRHWLSGLNKVRQRHDVQIHSTAFFAAQSLVRCLCPAALFRNEVGFYEFLKCFLALVHGSHHLSLSCYRLIN